MTKLEGAGAGMAAAAGLVRTATVPLPSLSPDMLAEKGAAAATSAPSPISTRMPAAPVCPLIANQRSEEHTSELQSLMRTSYAVFCLKKKTDQIIKNSTPNQI